MTQHLGTAGGSAAAGGIAFQARVVAYYSVIILAASEGAPPLGLAANVTLEYVRCETGAPVDDFLVGTSAGGHIFGQAKRTLTLSKSPDSELASVVSQFVRQYLANLNQRNPPRPWNAPLDADRDRLVLFVSPEAPATIRAVLARVLDASRRLHVSQRLADAATNSGQKEALAAFELHARRGWQNATGENATDYDLKRLASMCHVSEASVETNGTDERAANETLRRSILQAPEQANAAWHAIISFAVGLSQRRAGTDRKGLQQFLIENAIPLNVQREYSADVENLRSFTQIGLQSLEPLSRIAIGSHTIHLERDISAALWTQAQKGSLLVVGEPGAGKSGCLSDLCHRAEALAHDVVLILVDRFEAKSERSFSTELGLTHDFVHVLQSWPGDKPGFLVFDALDAARDERTATVIRDIIEKIRSSNGRWVVVASIRKYDLRYSKKLSRLFPEVGAVQFADPEFQAVRHVLVPLLSDDELSELGAQSSDLEDVLASASPPLRRLLRVPFNVRLVAELLGIGLSASQVTPARTQLDLLNAYWEHRVLREDQRGRDRERLLHELCVRLIDKLGLQVETISLSSSGPDLDDLLSQNVLVECQPASSSTPNPYRLAFSHHVLFDYAAARLLLRGDPDSLIQRLNDSKEFVLFARPSVHLHLQHLWESDRTEFWTVTLKILRADKIPIIAGLLGPAIVANEARSLSDLRHLLTASSTSEAEREVVLSFLRHLVGALIANKSPLIGSNAGPWCELAAELSEHFTPGVAHIVRTILANAIESTETFSHPQLIAANSAGRALLAHCWNNPASEHAVAAVAVQATCRTFGGGQPETAAAIRALLSPEHLASRGYIELPWLAGEIPALLVADPHLAADIYIGAFSFHDRSRDKTPVGGSRIMALVSDRQQDYEHAWWQLAEAFPRFLAAQPREAIRALSGVVDAYVERELHPYGGPERRELTFRVRDRDASIRTDHSEVWDAGIAKQHDAPIKMLNTLYARIADAASTDHGADELLDAIADFAKSAVFWKRLLVTATELGSALLGAASELCAAHVVLVGDDTSVAAGSFLQARFVELGQPARAAIELALVEIPQHEPPESRRQATRIRARLLGCLPDTLLSDPTRRLLSDLRQAAAVPPNEPSFRITEFTSSPITTETHWKQRGVPVDLPAVREVLELTEPVEAFASKFLNSAPSMEDASKALVHVNALCAVLENGKEGLHEAALAAGWSHLASACARMAHCQQLDCAAHVGQRTTDLLLTCATKSEPLLDSEQEAQFETSPSWGSPAARIDAAAGLMGLAQRPTCNSDEVRAAILALSRDPVSAVRFQVAQRLLTLYTTSNAFFWSVAEQLASNELNSSVLSALLGSSVGRLAGREPDRVVALTTRVAERTDATERKQVQSLALSIIGEIYVYRDHAEAGEHIARRIERTPKAPQLSRDLVRTLRQALTYGTDSPEDTNVRLRAFNVIQRVLQQAQRELDAMIASYDSGASNWSESELERARQLGSVVNEVCSQIYFASGAFDLRQGGQDSLPEPTRKRFYLEASPLLDTVLSARIPSGVHHLVQALASYIDQAPEETFLRVATAVRNGAASGYHLESLAEGLIVSIVQRYLADYRQLLRDNVRCRTALMDVLDIFVGAGWPSARALTFGLEEIFR